MSLESIITTDFFKARILRENAKPDEALKLLNITIAYVNANLYEITQDERDNIRALLPYLGVEIMQIHAEQGRMADAKRFAKSLEEVIPGIPSVRKILDS